MNKENIYNTRTYVCGGGGWCGYCCWGSRGSSLSRRLLLFHPHQERSFSSTTTKITKDTIVLHGQK